MGGKVLGQAGGRRPLPPCCPAEVLALCWHMDLGLRFLEVCSAVSCWFFLLRVSPHLFLVRGEEGEGTEKAQSVHVLNSGHRRVCL